MIFSNRGYGDDYAGIRTKKLLRLTGTVVTSYLGGLH